MMQTVHQPEYNYSKLVEAAKKEAQYESFSVFIDEKIHEIRNQQYYGEAHNFTRSTLAEMIGINVSTLTRIINRSQDTRKRDLIIAICFALQLTESETTLAMNLYPMVPLNPNNLRDLVILNALHDGVSVKQLDDILISHGFPKLRILRGNGKNEDHSGYYPLTSTKYNEVSVNVVPYCIAGEDSELSLHDRYSPCRYNYRSEMIIEEKSNNGLRYRITEDDGEYDIYLWDGENWKCTYSSHPFQQFYEDVLPCDKPELLNEIAKLKDYTDRKARYVHSMCNDTKNYGSRFDAVNTQGQLLIYGEGFDFDAPELSEYYQIEVTSGQCLFTISNSSRFLEKYLGADRWRELYGALPSPAIERYTSLDEVPNQRWREHFEVLLKSARDFLTRLQNRQLFLFNARAWFEIDTLMHVFLVEEAFECFQPDDLPYEIVPKKERIIGSDGKEITVNDLYRAAELDISSIEELCAVRSRYGSLEQFLQIDMLTEQKGQKYE